jgi:GntR family transcriptional repressor for pyruvate dehydrogenase complex
MEEFQVSRNCIREAIKCLTAGGIAVSKPGKGTTLVEKAKEIVLRKELVLDFSDYNSLPELIELRLIIEPEAAALAAQRAKPDQIKTLGKLLQDLNRELELGGPYVDPGLKSHNLIAEMTGNPYIIKITRSIYEELHKSRLYLLNKNIVEPERSHDHQNLYEAIRDRNPEKARNFMRIHIEHYRELYLE